MNKPLIIPRNLISREHVYVDFNRDTNAIDISFSSELNEELRKWPKDRLKDMKHDILSSVEYWFLHEPMNTCPMV